MRGGGERGLRRDPVAEVGFVAEIAGDFRMQQRGTLCQRRGAAHHRRERRVVDPDQLAGILGCVR